MLSQQQKVDSTQVAASTKEIHLRNKHLMDLNRLNQRDPPQESEKLMDPNKKLTHQGSKEPVSSQ